MHMYSMLALFGAPTPSLQIWHALELTQKFSPGEAHSQKVRASPLSDLVDIDHSMNSIQSSYYLNNRFVWLPM